MRPWWMVGVMACSSAPPPGPVPPEPRPAPSDASVTDDAHGADEPPVEATDAAVAVQPASEWPAEVGQIPPIAGPVTPIAQGKTVTVGGIEVTMGAPSHKHAMRGRSVGIWRFTLARGGKRAEITLRSSADRFEAEVAELGAFLVLRHVSYTEFEIVLAGTRVPTEASEDECEELVDARVKALGLPRANGHNSSVDHGVYRHGEAGWVAYCGLYSRRVWVMRAERD